MSNSEPATHQDMWDEWFNEQWDIVYCIERLMREKHKDKSDGFKVALYSAIIEHCAETMRQHIPDVERKGNDS